MPQANALSTQIRGNALLDIIADTSKTAMVISQTVLSRKTDLGDNEGVRNTMPYVSANLCISTSAHVFNKLSQRDYTAAIKAALSFIPFILMVIAQNQEEEYTATVFFNTALLFQSMIALCSSCPEHRNTTPEFFDNTLNLLPTVTFSAFTLSNKPAGMFNIRSATDKSPGFSPETMLYAVNSAERCAFSLGLFCYHGLQDQTTQHENYVEVVEDNDAEVPAGPNNAV